VIIMRIVHIASEYPPLQVFGLGRAVHDLAVAQAAQGHEVHVVTNSIHGRDPDAVVEGVHVHRISFPPPPKLPDDTMAVTQFNIAALETAARCVGRHGEPEAIHVHDWLTVLSGRMLKWLHPQARLVCTIHDTAWGKSGRTALDLAVDNDRTEVVSLLRQHGAPETPSRGTGLWAPE